MLVSCLLPIVVAMLSAQATFETKGCLLLRTENGAQLGRDIMESPSDACGNEWFSMI